MLAGSTVAERITATTQVGGTEAALFDYGRGGPQWGADALVIGPPQVSHHSHQLAWSLCHVVPEAAASQCIV